MKRPKLSVEKRAVFGKKLKKLRRDGIFPANIYGKDITSIAVQLPYKTFVETYKEHGETGLLDVEVDGKLHPVLIHNVQLDHISHDPLHADFFQVNLKEKVKTNVPVELTGEAQAVADKVGLLMQPLSEVEIEALPEDLPEKIEVPVEHLAAIDDQVTVADLKAPTGVTILTDEGQVVAKIAELVSKEAEEEAKAEAQASEEAKEEGAEADAQNAEEVKEEAKEAAEKEE